MSDDLPPPVNTRDELFEQMAQCKDCKKDPEGMCPYHDGALYMLEVD